VVVGPFESAGAAGSPAAGSPANVDAARIVQADHDPGNWMTYGRTIANSASAPCRKFQPTTRSSSAMAPRVIKGRVVGEGAPQAGRSLRQPDPGIRLVFAGDPRAGSRRAPPVMAPMHRSLGRRRCTASTASTSNASSGLRRRHAPERHQRTDAGDCAAVDARGDACSGRLLQCDGPLRMMRGKARRSNSPRRRRCITSFRQPCG